MIPRCSYEAKEGRRKSRCRYREGHEGPHFTELGQHVEIRYVGPLNRPGNVYIVRHATAKRRDVINSADAHQDSIPCSFALATQLAKDIAHNQHLTPSVIHIGESES